MTPTSSTPSDEELRKLWPEHPDFDKIENKWSKTEQDAIEKALRAAYLAGRDAGLEMAAKECESQGRYSQAMDGTAFYVGTGQCAKAIRALKGKP